MSQFSLSSDASLLVRDGRGRYRPASADQILDAARRVIDQKMQRGTEFSSPATVKEYLRTKLAGFEHEVFAILADGLLRARGPDALEYFTGIDWGTHISIDSGTRLGKGRDVLQSS